MDIPPFPQNLLVADLVTVDFDLLQSGDQDQAKLLFDATRGYGFFHLKNHHVDSDFMFELADAVFKLPYEEKMKYDMGTTGNYFGYKQSGSQYVDAKGTPDKSEFYNVSKDDILHVGDKERLEHPQPVNDRRGELETFMRNCHNVVLVIAKVLGEQLGLPEGLLPSLHRIDRTGGDQARITHAPPASSETITLGEHTDFGSITVLFNQLGGLQVLEPNTDEFKYVEPKAGCAIINLGDAIVKMVDEKLYSGLHRTSDLYRDSNSKLTLRGVVGPPGDQSKCPRHSVVYFSRPNGDVRLGSLFGDERQRQEAPTADEWIAHRAKMRSTANYKGPETLKLSQGTEHNRERDDVKASLDKPKTAVEAI